MRRRNEPPLKLPHTSLKQDVLHYLSQQSTEAIVDSLQPGRREALIVKAVGTVLNGNHPVNALRQRGYDVNSLPREHHEG